ncbi:ribosomal RNA-processing protein 8-like [Dysidea avara]|uniref:ribosomal RNA-processing protein 8-like n=1 Tax=Dysidea avara TaxID=196820 RepID=UPI00331809A6
MFAIDDDWRDESSGGLTLCDQVFGREHDKSSSERKTGKSKKKIKRLSREDHVTKAPKKSPEDHVMKVPKKSSAARRLEGSQFRWINEQLYTMSSKQARELFQSQPDLYDVYHKGFGAQVDKWPCHPLDNVIRYISSLPHHWVIADMGCGEGRLAASVSHEVHCFDLVAYNKRVTACDMANVPLECASVNVVVFCLSLMGTNLSDFISEAHRILVPKGILKITEICSRIDDVDLFVLSLCSYGFRLIKKENLNKMFIDLVLKKTKRSHDASPMSITLKPCLYKRR